MRIVWTSRLGPSSDRTFGVGYRSEHTNSAVTRALKARAAPSPQSRAPTPTPVQNNSGATESLVSQNHALYLTSGQCSLLAGVQEPSRRGSSDCAFEKEVFDVIQLVYGGGDAPVIEQGAGILYCFPDL
jgi:hypothetical protein